MHRAHLYIASLFLTAALVAPAAIMAVPYLRRPVFRSESMIRTTTIITTGMTTKIALGEYS